MGAMLNFSTRTCNTGGVTNAGRRRTQADVLDAQVKQRQQDGHRLLLVPAQHQRQRQLVDAALEGLGQGQRDLDGRIGVVALPHVQKPRNAVDRAEVELVEAILAAGQGEDDAVLGHLLGEVGVVVAARLGAVAAADEEEMADRPLLDRRDHLVGHAQHGIAAETDGNRLLLRRIGREAGRRQGSTITGVKSRSGPMWVTPGQATSPLVKMRPR